MCWRRTELVATWLTAMAFAVLNGYVSGFSSIWNYNTHLNIFLVALSFSPARSTTSQRSDEVRSSIVFFMRLQVAIIYLQAGLAKLVLGGLNWPSRAPFIHLVLQGSWASSWFTSYPQLIEMGGVLVIAIELSLPVLLMCRRTRRAAALVAIGLHSVFFVTLGISFWHLWVLFPALFLLDSAQSRTHSGLITQYATNRYD
ncbi:hypothetical protein RO07_12455 [Pandoraea pulmonicola]|nr:hypothetical protein RO07_12455 [Pandoraea pulmonicola]